MAFMRNGGCLRNCVTVFLALAASESLAHACTACAFAAADTFLTPIGYWVTLALVWTLTVMVIRARHRAPLPGMKSMGEALVAVALCLVGSALFGPFPFAALAILSLITTVRSLLPGCHPPVKAWARKALVVVAMAMVTSTVAGAFLAVKTLAERTTADYLVQWCGTWPAYQKLDGLRKQPDGLATLREVVDRAECYMLGKAADRLVEMGDPEQDLPRLKRAWARVVDRPQLAERIDAAIKAWEARRGDAVNPPSARTPGPATPPPAASTAAPAP